MIREVLWVVVTSWDVSIQIYYGCSSDISRQTHLMEGTQEKFALHTVTVALSFIYWSSCLLPLGGGIEHRLYCLPSELDITLIQISQISYQIQITLWSLWFCSILLNQSKLLDSESNICSVFNWSYWLLAFTASGRLSINYWIRGKWCSVTFSLNCAAGLQVSTCVC